MTYSCINNPLIPELLPLTNKMVCCLDRGKLIKSYSKESTSQPIDSWTFPLVMMSKIDLGVNGLMETILSVYSGC